MHHRCTEVHWQARLCVPIKKLACGDGQGRAVPVSMLEEALPITPRPSEGVGRSDHQSNFDQVR